MPLMTKPSPTFSLGRIYRVGSTAPATPRQYGLIKAFSAELSYETKELQSENVFPEFVVRAGAKLTGKIEIQEDSALDLLNVSEGSTSASGSKVLAYKEAGTVPAASTYTITVTHSAQLSKNLGVTDAATGKGMQRVSSAPSTGEYSVDEATGIYTFAAADANKSVLITYEYTSTSGTTVTVSQSIAQAGTSYDSILVYNETMGVKRGLYLPRVIIPKIPFGLALKEWASFAYDFVAYPDPITGKVMDRWEA